ncbi:siderophore-iron reductase FhuF [Variovorax sp. UC122_21]|uniref:siderophore-iron reductase FhuF n=1 Tax=Variovorax sp. UC122_21 TaxID=3374554 RepID=UPI003756770C
MIPLLKPLFQGELAEIGEKLQCAATPPVGALRVSDLLRSEAVLADIIARQARWRRVSSGDLRAVASAWTLDYLSTLLPPVVAAASVLQHAFPMAAAQVWLRMDDDGNPLDFHILSLGEARHGTGTAQRYGPLLRQHLQPLFETLRALTRVPTRLLWSNTARYLEPVFDQALALTGGSAPIARDRDRLLHEPAWPGADGGAATVANPMQRRQRVVQRLHEGRPVALKLHRHCCLYHLLPGEGYCGACPLSPQHRQGAADEDSEEAQEEDIEGA